MAKILIIFIMENGGNTWNLFNSIKDPEEGNIKEYLSATELLLESN